MSYDVEAANEPGLCTVMEQKQTQTGFKDEMCGKAVTEYSAGLCECVGLSFVTKYFMLFGSLYGPQERNVMCSVSDIL